MRMTKKNRLFALAAGCLCAVLGACQSATPAKRIAANPVLFNSLPEEHRAMVQQGLICQGMSQNAVLLAWGSPDNRATGQTREGRMYERWEYTAMQPVTTVHAGFGGWFGPGPYWYPYGGSGLDTTYIPRCAASVDFEDGQVARWMHNGR